MSPEDRKELEAWCRYACVDDTRDDGICRFVMKFKARDQRMDVWMLQLSHEDACEIAAHICEETCPGCEDCYDDWMDPDEKTFTLDVRLEDGFIVMEGKYRS